MGGCPRGPQRHLNAATRHEAATRAHGRSAAFWAAQGEIERAQLQRDLAEHERRGAALERRWAVLIERDGRFAGGTDLDAPGGGDGDDGLDRRDIALEMGETEIVIRERQVDDRDSFGDGRDAVADKRDREADERERPIYASGSPMGLNSERLGCAVRPANNRGRQSAAAASPSPFGGVSAPAPPAARQQTMKVAATRTTSEFETRVAARRSPGAGNLHHP